MSQSYHCSIYAFTTPAERQYSLGPYKSLSEAVMMSGIDAETWIRTHPVKDKTKPQRATAKSALSRKTKTFVEFDL